MIDFDMLLAGSTKARTLERLNLYEQPKLGAKIIGVIPSAELVSILDWKVDETQRTVYACIGGYPKQWITAYRAGLRYVNYVEVE